MIAAPFLRRETTVDSDIRSIDTPGVSFYHCTVYVHLDLCDAGRAKRVTENQRRTEDLLTKRDLVLRTIAVIALIVAALTALLATQPL